MAVEAEETAATKRAGGVIMFIYDVVVAGRNSKGIKPWAGCEVGHQNFTLTSSHRHEPSKQIRLMMRRYERAGLFRDDGASPYAIIRYILMTDIFITKL